MRARDLASNIVIPSLLVLTALNFRLRLGGGDIHLGGAELSIAPYDLILPVLIFLHFISPRSRSQIGVVQHAKHPVNGAAWAAMIFVICSFVSVVNSTALEYSLYEVVRHLKVILIFILIKRYIGESDSIKSLSATSAAIILAELLFSIVQLTMGNADVAEDAAEVREVFVENGITRVSGTLRHPGTLSLYINLLLPYIVLGLLHGKRKSIYITCLFSSFLIIVLTYSRTQIVVYFFVLLLCMFMLEGRRGRSLALNRGAILAAVLLFVLLMGIGFLNYENLYARFAEAPESSSSVRWILAGIAFEMFLQHPIVGVGWNTFVDAMSEYDAYGASQSFPFPVHNLYLLILSETGLLGLLSFLWLLFVFYQQYKMSLRALSGALERNATRAAVISTIVILVTGLQGWSFRLDSILIVTWINFALIAALYERSRSFVLGGDLK